MEKYKEEVKDNKEERRAQRSVRDDDELEEIALDLNFNVNALNRYKVVKAIVLSL